MKFTLPSFALSTFAAAVCWGPATALATCDGSVPGVLTCTGTFDPTINPVMGSFNAPGLHTLDVSGLTADIVKSSAGHMIRASGLTTDFVATIDLAGQTLESTATAGPTLSHLIYLANASANSISATISNGRLVAEGGAPSVTGIIAFSTPATGSGGDVTIWQQSDLDIIARPSVGGAPVTALSAAQGIFATSRMTGSVFVRSDGDISADTFGIWANIQGEGGVL